MRNPHAGEPFTDDDQAIAAALEEVSVPALLCSLVHMTGDPAWIRGDIRPRVAMSLDIQSAIPAGERAEVRRRALPAIAAYRDGGCAPHELPRELLQEMMSFLGCQPVEGRLAGLYFDDLQFAGGDTSAITWGDDIPAEAKTAAPVVVVGCGLAGILAGIRLRQAGLPFVVGEPLPGRPGRRGEPPVTATRSSPRTTGASSTAGSRSCVPTSPRSSTSTACARTAGSTPPLPG